MPLQRTVNKFRYNFWVAYMLRLLSYPLFLLSRAMSAWITRKVKINGKPVLFFGKKIIFPPNVGININTKIYWKGSQEFEPLTSKTLVTLFSVSDVFFDIGSNFGIYSVLAQKINRNIEVHCFEPLPNIYEDNLKFHSVNGTNRQRVYNIGLSSEAGNVKLFVPDVYAIDSEITSSSIERSFFYNQKFQTRQLDIRTRMLDEFKDLTSLMDKRILLKIDVEGHELSLLAGGHLFLSERRPVIVIEIDKNESNVKSLWRFFKDSRYCVYAMTNIGYFRLSLDAFLEFKGGRDFLLLPIEKSGNKDYIHSVERIVDEKIK
jgi:FkbM family methyltransferase